MPNKKVNLNTFEILRVGLEGIQEAVREKGYVEPREILALVQALMILIDHLESKEKAA
jgi:hypothetical protein